MKACPDRQEILCLDVHGELSPEMHLGLQKHLESCAGCREERSRLLKMLQRVREAIPTPGLPSEAANRFCWAVKNDMNGLEGKRGGRSWLSPKRLLPALSGVALLVMAVGWFTMKGLHGPPMVSKSSNLLHEDNVMAKDLDLIKNLKLLEEMDALQKLVQVVDRKEVI